MESKDQQVLNYIMNFINAETYSLKNIAYSYNDKRIKTSVEQALLENKEIFNMITEPVLQELLDQKLALKWDYIAQLTCLSEGFIKENFKGLSPSVILANYPDLSEETKSLFYPYIGVLNRLKMKIEPVETEEAIIANYSKYGRKLKKKIRNYIKANDDVSESLILFIKLVT